MMCASLLDVVMVFAVGIIVGALPSMLVSGTR